MESEQRKLVLRYAQLVMAQRSRELKSSEASERDTIFKKLSHELQANEEQILQLAAKDLIESIED